MIGPDLATQTGPWTAVERVPVQGAPWKLGRLASAAETSVSAFKRTSTAAVGCPPHD